MNVYLSRDDIIYISQRLTDGSERFLVEFALSSSLVNSLYQIWHERPVTSHFVVTRRLEILQLTFGLIHPGANVLLFSPDNITRVEL